MAVLSSIQHPNVVQVFACLTNMVEVPLSGEQGLLAGPTSARHR
jgi:hypothetical protein